MELKSYQKKVIADLTRYLELLNETNPPFRSGICACCKTGENLL